MPNIAQSTTERLTPYETKCRRLTDADVEINLNGKQDTCYEEHLHNKMAATHKPGKYGNRSTAIYFK